jgi:hypothetical protein
MAVDFMELEVLSVPLVAYLFINQIVAMLHKLRPI